MDSFRDEIRKADSYMAADNKEEATIILEKLFERFPDRKNLYGDAINIYLAGKMHEEAKSVFGRYKSIFGEDLRCADFSLAEIEREQKEYESAARNYDNAAVKVFKRMSVWERGRVSGLPMFFPVKEIGLSQDEIVFRKGGREFRYVWSDIQDASITNWKGYKGYAFCDSVIKILSLRTRDQTFKIDVSTNYPDFKYNEILLKELQKRIILRQDKSSVKTFWNYRG